MFGVTPYIKSMYNPWVVGWTLLHEDLAKCELAVSELRLCYVVASVTNTTVIRTV